MFLVKRRWANHIKADFTDSGPAPGLPNIQAPAKLCGRCPVLALVRGHMGPYPGTARRTKAANSLRPSRFYKLTEPWKPRSKLGKNVSGLEADQSRG
jgi:hypothetical protein